MFMLKASRYIEELEKYNPDTLDVCRRAIDTETHDLDSMRIDAETFPQCKDYSIDYAVMERTVAAIIVSLIPGWLDVGSWTSRWEARNKD